MICSEKSHLRPVNAVKWPFANQSAARHAVQALYRTPGAYLKTVYKSLPQPGPSLEMVCSGPLMEVQGCFVKLQDW